MKKKTLSFKQLKAKYWKKVRLHILERDKHKCQLCGRPVDGRDAQVDHCLSRSHQGLHFREENLTLLCSGCHVNKTYHNADTHEQVSDLVIRREGEDVFEQLRFESRKPRKISEEEILDIIEELKERYPLP